jgi:hypothetical protein
MVLPDWAIFALGMITFHILKGLWLIVETEVKKYREKRFLKFVQVHFPNHEKITFVTIDATDKRAMAKTGAGDPLALRRRRMTITWTPISRDR